MGAAADDPLLTESDLAGLPDDGLLHELRAGLLLAEPRPFPLHARVQARIVVLVDAFVRARGLGVVLSDAGFLLARDPDTVRGPDVSFVRRGRWDAVADENRFFPGAPDLAVEVLSPSNRRAELKLKVADYLDAGAAGVWVVDPAEKAVTVYLPGAAPVRLDAGDTLDGGGVLPGFAIQVATLFEL